MAHRNPVNKRASAGKFRKQTQYTKANNLPRTVMRGGWRL